MHILTNFSGTLRYVVIVFETNMIVEISDSPRAVFKQKKKSLNHTEILYMILFRQKCEREKY